MANKITGNDFEELFDTVVDQEDETALIYDDNNIPSPCENDLLPCDGTGSGSTNPCPPGMELRCIEECPPGWTLECIPPEPEYPSGSPYPGECRIEPFGFDAIFEIVEINNRIWICCGNNIFIYEKDATLYKTISRNHSGYQDKTNNIACANATLFGDRVMIGSNILQNGPGPTAWDFQYWVPIYTHDGDFIEMWELGDFWEWSTVDVNVPNKSCNVEDIDLNGGVVAISSVGRRSNRAGGYEYGAIAFDYYGTIVTTYREVYTDHTICHDGLTRVGNKVWNGNYFSKPSILNADYSIDEFLLPPCDTSLQAWSSAGMKCLDRTDGIPYVLILNARGNVGVNCNQRFAHLYNYDGTHYISIEVPEPQAFDCEKEYSKFADNNSFVDRLGDSIIISATEYGPNVTSLNRLGSGKVYVFDITTGIMKREIGLSSLPYPEARHMLGSGVRLFSDQVWMFAAEYNADTYLKICDINWN